MSRRFSSSKASARQFDRLTKFDLNKSPADTNNRFERLNGILRKDQNAQRLDDHNSEMGKDKEYNKFSYL
jgi:hypothetical protein